MTTFDVCGGRPGILGTLAAGCDIGADEPDAGRDASPCAQPRVGWERKRPAASRPAWKPPSTTGGPLRRSAR